MISVDYVEHMGSDLTVVNSARVSFAVEKEELEDDDERLIRYLARHKHWTPFSHPQITLRETVPIFVARQRFKHMVGFTYNEISRRYVDQDVTFYVPSEWRSRPPKGIKQGSGDTHPNSEAWKRAYADLIRHTSSLYISMIHEGVAPEMARMILPQSMMTSYYVTGSLAAFARAYCQRIDHHAQREIQFLAREWEFIIKRRFPISWKYLVEEASAHDQ
jgi:thymidylate synthase (FAD)